MGLWESIGNGLSKIIEILPNLEFGPIIHNGFKLEDKDKRSSLINYQPPSNEQASNSNGEGEQGGEESGNNGDGEGNRRIEPIEGEGESEREDGKREETENGKITEEQTKEERKREKYEDNSIIELYKKYVVDVSPNPSNYESFLREVDDLIENKISLIESVYDNIETPKIPFNFTKIKEEIKNYLSPEKIKKYYKINTLLRPEEKKKIEKKYATIEKILGLIKEEIEKIENEYRKYLHEMEEVENYLEELEIVLEVLEYKEKDQKTSVERKEIKEVKDKINKYKETLENMLNSSFYKEIKEYKSEVKKLERYLDLVKNYKKLKDTKEFEKIYKKLEEEYGKLLKREIEKISKGKGYQPKFENY